MDWGNIIASAVGICGVVFGFAAWRREESSTARRDGMVLTELGYIKSGIDDIKRKQERQQEQIVAVTNRLTALEERVRVAHKRIDELSHPCPPAL